MCPDNLRPYVLNELLASNGKALVVMCCDVYASACVIHIKFAVHSLGRIVLCLSTAFFLREARDEHQQGTAQKYPGSPC